MTSNLYIASIEPGCGKSVISLGVANLVAKQFDSVGFFRPIISDREGRDTHIELLRSRYCPDRPYESLYGVSHETARQRSDAGEMSLLLDQIDRRYAELSADCQIVVCEGTDHSRLASPFDFEFDARLANRFNCRVVLVTSGRRRSGQDAADIACAAYDAFTRQDCQIAATLVSRVPDENSHAVKERLAQRADSERLTFVLPEVESLAKPTAGQIANAIGARPLIVDANTDSAVVANCRVAAMQLTHFLKYINEQSLVITPGDRTDVILAALASHAAETYPKIAGIILTGDLEPTADVVRLLEGSRPLPLPIYLTADDTYTTAMKVHTARPTMTLGDQAKITSALAMFNAAVDQEALETALLKS